MELTTDRYQPEWDAVDGLLNDSALNELIEAWVNDYDDGPLIAAKREAFDAALLALVTKAQALGRVEALREAASHCGEYGCCIDDGITRRELVTPCVFHRLLALAEAALQAGPVDAAP